MLKLKLALVDVTNCLGLEENNRYGIRLTADGRYPRVRRGVVLEVKVSYAVTVESIPKTVMTYPLPVCVTFSKNATRRHENP
ncbi:hypothetical protein PoB_001153500 [Plakobranchus ocellatus]|uniref:Uncharacterized protein n=1 Tax=Plakobranchus ocellatus TaxID=259542 RepID=A0AAV3YRG6_9GAST|nr:hypothetical protein PoB_001153500 [Plakobranchus ocellatus]